ncbi:MAG: Maf family nucleotide pyrophosphatase [Candidatus Cryptobacteroides sp.]
MDQGHKHIILASGSPRRRELLAGLGLEFEVDTRNSFEESCDPGTPAREVPLLMARGKSHGFHRALEDDEILITADTVVIAKDAGGRTEVLGKPRDRQDACRMLRELSGQAHEVVTAVVIRDSVRELAFTDSTAVHFAPLEESEIDYYVDNFKPYDKAGAYGIQEWIGFAAITGIEGSYFNVMGLPVHRLWRELKSFFK